MNRITGYTSEFGVRTEDTLTFYVSTPEPCFTAELHRLFSVDDRPGGPGRRVESVASDISGQHPGAEQKSSIGSYAITDSSLDLPAGSQLLLSLAMYATLTSDGAPQWIAHFQHEGSTLGLRMRDRSIELVWNEVAVVTTELTVHDRVWYRLVLTSGHDGFVLAVARDGSAERSTSAAPARSVKSTPTDVMSGRFALGAPIEPGTGRGGFNGKIAEVRIGAGAIAKAEVEAIVNGRHADSVLRSRLVSGWNFADFTHTHYVPNVVAGRPALRLVNAPARAVTGPRWRGDGDVRTAPAIEYDAVHVNDDMVVGGDWEPSLTWRVPRELESGIYALRVADSASEDWIPFYVRPREVAKRKRILFLAPTNTYLAYGNEHNATDDMGAELGSLKVDEVVPEANDLYVDDHPELGLSLYDWHRDGTGVRYASRLRPLLNMRPFHRNWLNGSYRHFAADFYLIEWLHHHGFEFDVATDDDLHREGIALLETYSVVLTGSHPEYVSGRMLDALTEYRSGGGNLMYLGGNGFYWVVAHDPSGSGTMEMRRGVSGARNFDSQPGESVLSYTRETGGIWRNRGRSPHRLTGIGMGAIGWGQARPYQRTEASYDSNVSWVFAGINEDLIGSSGLMLGGAAGDEMDHTDDLHGTPPETVILASSVGHDDRFQPVIEDYTNIYPDLGSSKNPLVRADLTLLQSPGQGSVFSVGSICWIGALPVNGYDNPVSKVTENVLSRFA